MTVQNKKHLGVPVYCGVVLILFAVILFVPSTREMFRMVSGTHPFALGFVKFALLATTGELLAARIGAKAWALPDRIFAKALIWGVIGAALAFMLKIYSGGVGAMIEGGVLPIGNSVFLRALVTSAVMNLTFGPVMMGFHKMTDQYLALKTRRSERTDLRTVAQTVDWENFVVFVLLKTIPLFWIPAHTVTFMLPAEYQTIMAAVLSIALGIILSLKKKAPDESAK